MSRWEITYTYRETPGRHLRYAAYPTRRAARERLASIMTRCRNAGNVVESHGPDAFTHANRTLYSVSKRPARDALGRALPMLAGALLVAGLMFGQAGPVAASELPGAECFAAADPSVWQPSVDAMPPAQLEALDACLDRAGWDRMPDAPGRFWNPRDADDDQDATGTGAGTTERS